MSRKVGAPFGAVSPTTNYGHDYADRRRGGIRHEREVSVRVTTECITMSELPPCVFVSLAFCVEFREAEDPG